MTIDEAISKYRNRVEQYKDWENMKDIAEEHEQLAEWLEELNSYKLGECMNDCEHYDNCSNYIYSKGYTKAIDDFADKVEFVVGAEDRDIYCKETVKEIAEQLKAGELNV